MPFWTNVFDGDVFRIGLTNINVAGQRSFMTRTFRYSGPTETFLHVEQALDFACAEMASPFTFVHSDLHYSGWLHFKEQLHPQQRMMGHIPIQVDAVHPLNPAAPEAAFRLQRVGAAPHRNKKGRINYPILSDRWFTDVPHRRHVDVATIRPLLALGAHLWLPVIHAGAGFVTDVIFNRQDRSFVVVGDHELQPSTTRVWQRSHIYPRKPGHTDDDVWVPNELDE